MIFPSAALGVYWIVIQPSFSSIWVIKTKVDCLIIGSALHPRDHLSVGTLTVQHSIWLVQRRVGPRGWDLAPSPLQTPESLTHWRVGEEEGRGLSSLVTRLMTDCGSRRLQWSEIAALPASLSAASFPQHQSALGSKSKWFSVSGCLWCVLCDVSDVCYCL